MHKSTPTTVAPTGSSNNSITLSGSDSEGGNLTYTLVSNPSQGKLSGTAPNLTYVPKAGFSGSDNFTFKANDGTSDSNIATVMILLIQLMMFR